MKFFMEDKCLIDTCTTFFAHSKAWLSTMIVTITGVGLSTLIGWLEKGIGLTASVLGVVVAWVMIKKIRAETRESELRAKKLEND